MCLVLRIAAEYLVRSSFACKQPQRPHSAKVIPAYHYKRYISVNISKTCN